MVVVGAGPCGLAAAVAAGEQGLRSVVFDRGCVARSLTRYPYYMSFFSTAERLEIGGVPFTTVRRRPTRQEALAYYRRVVAYHGLRVRQYQEVTGVVPAPRGDAGAGAESLGPGTRFSVHTRDHLGCRRTIETSAVVIATGGLGTPNRLELEDGPAPERVVHEYREPHPYFDQDVVVVGGGNSAVETALDLYRGGVRVRMVHFAAGFDRGVKPWVRPDIDNRIAGGEIVMHWRSRVVSMGSGTARIVDGDTGAERDVPADWIMAMTGWRPDSTLLRTLDVTIDPDTGIPDHDAGTMETNTPGVYIAGVIAAGYDANKIFIENGRAHGALIARHVGRRRVPAASAS